MLIICCRRRVARNISSEEKPRISPNPAFGFAYSTVEARINTIHRNNCNFFMLTRFIHALPAKIFIENMDKMGKHPAPT
jgi:hypothetical protein